MDGLRHHLIERGALASKTEEATFDSIRFAPALWGKLFIWLFAFLSALAMAHRLDG